MQRTFVRASRWRRGQILWALLLVASPAAAAPAEPDAPLAPAPSSDTSAATLVKVTSADITRLVEQHPRLAAGRFDVDAARAGVDAAGEVPNPTLEATVGFGRARVGDDSGVEWGLALTVPFGWVAQRGPRIEAAEAEVDVAEAESKILRRDVLVQLRTLFWNLAYEQARVASLETLEAQTSELVTTVSKRVEKDDARPVEGVRVEIELEKVLGRARGRTQIAGGPTGSARAVAWRAEGQEARGGRRPGALSPSHPSVTRRRPRPGPRIRLSRRRGHVRACSRRRSRSKRWPESRRSP